MTYRIFLFLKVSIVFVILLSICNIKILVLIISFLNESGYVVSRVIAFVLTDMSTILIMSFRLSLMNSTIPVSTLISMSPSITSYYSETSSSSVPLSPESPSDSFSTENESFEVLDSSLLESVSSFPVVLSR